MYAKILQKKLSAGWLFLVPLPSSRGFRAQRVILWECGTPLLPASCWALSRWPSASQPTWGVSKGDDAIDYAAMDNRASSVKLYCSVVEAI